MPAKSKWPGRIEPRHLGRFTAEQRAAVRATRARAAAHDVGRHRRIEFADRKVVEEKQRRRVDDQDVVDAVVDEIAPDAVVALQFGRDEDLRADAVGRCDQRAIAVAGEPKEPAEAADRIELIGVTPAGKNLL